MTRIKTASLFLCALALLVTPALGGPLATAPGVYFDGFMTWHGSSAFQGYYDPPFNTDPSNLTGTVDWAVWAPNTFPGGFSGYTPTAGEYVYTYQINVVGTAPVSQSIVFVVNQADNIGEFTGDAGFGLITGDSPSLSVLVPFSSAEWTFDGIAAGATSVGLAYSSLHAPDFSVDVLIDGGTFAVAAVPGPLGPAIPEPGSLALAACGVGVLSLYFGRRRLRREN
jgi:hypothetical protein